MFISCEWRGLIGSACQLLEQASTEHTGDGGGLLTGSQEPMGQDDGCSGPDSAHVYHPQTMLAICKPRRQRQHNLVGGQGVHMAGELGVPSAPKHCATHELSTSTPSPVRFQILCEVTAQQHLAVQGRFAS